MDALIALQRTVRHGSSPEEEQMPMDAWIPRAQPDELDRLLLGDLSIADEEDQEFLSLVWRDCAMDAGLRTDMHEHDDASVTYHWGEGCRRLLRRAVAALRPDHLEPDPNQGSLL